MISRVYNRLGECRTTIISAMKKETKLSADTLAFLCKQNSVVVFCAMTKMVICTDIRIYRYRYQYQYGYIGSIGYR